MYAIYFIQTLEYIYHTQLVNNYKKLYKKKNITGDHCV